MIASNKNAHLIAKSCMFKSSDISLMLKKIFNEEAEISVETDAETATDFEEKANLTEKLTRADNDAALII